MSQRDRRRRGCIARDARCKAGASVRPARTRRQLDESLGALAIQLTAAEVAEIEQAVPAAEVADARYAAPQMQLLDSER